MADDELLTIAQELADITRLVADDDVSGTLDRFVSRAVRTVPGCARATITIRADGLVDTVAAAGDPAVDETAEGPVLEALTFGEPRRLDDVATDQRWLGFAATMARNGYRSCLSLPLPTRSAETAVFTLYSSGAGQFADTSYDLVLLFTLHAGVVFDNAALYHDSTKLVEQLQAALTTRALVGRAQGLLMHRFTMGADRAFAALREASQNSNTKLRDVARLLVAAHEDGDLESVLAKFGLSGENPPPDK